jgi:hypothetical protein
VIAVGVGAELPFAGLLMAYGIICINGDDVAQQGGHGFVNELRNNYC